MLSIEVWILKNKYRLIAAMIILLAIVINPYDIYQKNKLQDLNQKRILVEKEFVKENKQRDNKFISSNLKDIEVQNKRLLMAILVNNSFKTNEYKSLKLKEEIYQSIKNKAIRMIVDLEIAIEDRDLGKLKELYNEVDDKNLKDYILYVLKNFDPEVDLEFQEDSVIKSLYIG